MTSKISGRTRTAFEQGIGLSSGRAASRRARSSKTSVQRRIAGVARADRAWREQDAGAGRDASSLRNRPGPEQRGGAPDGPGVDVRHPPRGARSEYRRSRARGSRSGSSNSDVAALQPDAEAQPFEPCAAGQRRFDGPLHRPSRRSRAPRPEHQHLGAQPHGQRARVGRSAAPRASSIASRHFEALPTARPSG